MDTPPPNPWNAPATVSAIVAFGSLALTAFLAWRSSVSAKKAKTAARESEETAANQRTFANEARAGIAAQLEEANRIAKDANSLREKETEYRFTLKAVFVPDENDSCLRVTVVNQSLTLPATMEMIGFTDKAESDSLLPFPMSWLSISPSRTIEAKRKAEFYLDARHMAHTYDNAMLAKAATLFVQFEHQERIYLTDSNVSGFLSLCQSLADKIRATPTTMIGFTWGGPTPRED